MESSIGSRKRKQRPSESDPFGGVFTRSRSQIYFHRHRSGYARSDLNRSRNVFKSVKGTADLVVTQRQSEVIVDDQVANQVSVIDLRARRVFSPATVADDDVSIGEAEFDVQKKSDGNPSVTVSEGDLGVFEPVAADDVIRIGGVDLEAEFDVQKKSDGNPNLSVSEDLGVFEYVAANDVVRIGKVDLEADFDVEKKKDAGSSDLEVLENVVDPLSVREDSVMDADCVVVVQMTPTVAEIEENKRSGEKQEMSSVANEVADMKGIMNKSQSSVTSLRGRRKVFKSPTSFSYRRLLPYLMDSGNDDSSSFEIIEATLPKNLKPSNPGSNMVACKDEEIGPVSNSSKLADGLLNTAKSCEKQILNGVNDGLTSTVEGYDVMQKSQEDVLNDTLECEQMTPPDSNTYSKSKINNDVSGVLLKPTSKQALKSCSRKKVLQTPTSFSHRRLLPFLMSVAEDYSSPLKDNQSLKLEKAIEQNQQPPAQLLHQNEKSTTADETSNSPTSTLIPVDASVDLTKAVTLVTNDNILDANGTVKEGSGLISQLEVNLQGEAVKSDSCIKTEQSPPKVNLKYVAEAAPLCIEQNYIEGQQKTVKESPTSIATPLCIEQSYSEDLQITVKESPTSIATPPCIEQSYSESHQKQIKESPQQNLMQIPETQVENIRNGILKRTPRGCRGICNCLNCTSFRLHAERSFEFSKNQMHDAEEVALELINDLACLRNILETTSSNSLDIVKEKQVKEACAKALYKEQEARARLAQMNEDLSIHCRSMNLLRPKVTFANKIEEKFISKDEIYGKKSV